MKRRIPYQPTERGFTLIELVVVIGLVGTLAATAIQGFAMYTSKARRVEAFTVLAGVYDAQKAFYGDQDQYAATFDQLGFSVDGGVRVAANQIQGRTYLFNLSRPWGINSFFCTATGNIDADEWPDVIAIEEGSPTKY